MSNNFGQYLKLLRKNAGFKSLDAAIADMPGISKSLLSVYERGQVQSISPENLKVLAKAYKVTYQELAKRWFLDRYGIQAEDSKDGISLLPAIIGDHEFKLHSVNKFIELQMALPKGAQVGVCASTLIDDDIFFDVVSSNLIRGVSYYYIAPDTERSNFNVFTRRIKKEIADSGKTFKGEIKFFPRPRLDFPLSFVLFLSEENIEAFIALPIGKAPSFYQKASPELVWRLYDSFHWIIAMSNDKELRNKIAQLRTDIELKKVNQQKVDISF